MSLFLTWPGMYGCVPVPVTLDEPGYCSRPFCSAPKDDPQFYHQPYAGARYRTYVYARVLLVLMTYSHTWCIGVCSFVAPS